MIEAGYFRIPSFFFANCTLWTNVSYILKSLNRYCNLLATAFSLPLTCPSPLAPNTSMNKLSHAYLLYHKPWSRRPRRIYRHPDPAP